MSIHIERMLSSLDMYLRDATIAKMYPIMSTNFINIRDSPQFIAFMKAIIMHMQVDDSTESIDNATKLIALSCESALHTGLIKLPTQALTAENLYHSKNGKILSDAQFYTKIKARDDRMKGIAYVMASNNNENREAYFKETNQIHLLDELHKLRNIEKGESLSSSGEKGKNKHLTPDDRAFYLTSTGKPLDNYKLYMRIQCNGISNTTTFAEKAKAWKAGQKDTFFTGENVKYITKLTEIKSTFKK